METCPANNYSDEITGDLEKRPKDCWSVKENLLQKKTLQNGKRKNRETNVWRERERERERQRDRERQRETAVSYTHLTLPTNHRV